MGSSDRYTTELNNSSRQAVAVRKPALAAPGLRFCAALYVVSLHYAPETLRAVSPAVRNFISAGYTAVSLVLPCCPDLFWLTTIWTRSAELT